VPSPRVMLAIALLRQHSHGACRGRVMLATVLSRLPGHAAMSLLSLADDGVAEVTLLPRRLGCGMMLMPMLT
jgi:hypothetical protein